MREADALTPAIEKKTQRVIRAGGNVPRGARDLADGAVELPDPELSIGRKGEPQRKRMPVGATDVQQPMSRHIAIAPCIETRRIVEGRREAVRRERHHRHRDLSLLSMGHHTLLGAARLKYESP
jgi:hypothetical protein